MLDCPRRTGGETARPVGWIASDFVSADERTLYVSLPVTTEAWVSDQPVVPDSK